MFIKWELRRFSVYPTVVPVGKKVTINIKGHNEYYRFFDEKEYIIRLIPKEFRDYTINDDFNIMKDEANTVIGTCKDGVISFEYTFTGEQEWHISLMPVGGHDEYFNKWRKKFKNLWNLNTWEKLYFDFRVYSVEEDLYKLNVYRGDTHTHTDASDGVDCAKLFCANYRGLGYDFIGITDHYEYSSSLKAIDIMSKIKTNFVVFPGEEVHVIPSGGRFHVVNFNGKSSVNTKIEEDYEGVKAEVFELAKKYTDLPERDAQEVAWNEWITTEIRKTGGLSIYAHPQTTISHAYNCPTNVTLEVLRRGLFDAYEITNTENEQERCLQAAMYYDLRCEGIKIPIVGATDAHASTDHGQAHAGNHSTIVFASCPEEIPDAIMDLRSTAASHTPGQDTHVYGSYRLVKYTHFLLENYFPVHDELCKASGILLDKYFKGHTELKSAVETTENVISDYTKTFFGR